MSSGVGSKDEPGRNRGHAPTLRLGSAAEALAYLEAARSEIPVGGRDYLLFRGERDAYPTMLPSAFRVPADRFHASLSLSYALASHFWSDWSCPAFVDSYGLVIRVSALVLLS